MSLLKRNFFRQSLRRCFTMQPAILNELNKIRLSFNGITTVLDQVPFDLLSCFKSINNRCLFKRPINNLRCCDANQ